MLVREVHHRVKNNLQLMSSLLNLEASRAGSPEVTRIGMQGIQPLIQLVNLCLSIAKKEEITLPDMSASTPTAAELLEGADPLEPIKAVRDVLQTVLETLEPICG